MDGNNLPGSDGQILSTTGTQTLWIPSFAPDAGQTTNTTLRWDGTAWVENDNVLSDGVTNTWINTANLEVNGATTASGTLTVADTLTAQSTVTLEAALVDGNNMPGSDGQILSTTGTQTVWVDRNATQIQMVNGVASATINLDTGLVLVYTSSTETTVTLNIPTVASFPAGYELKIRRDELHEFGRSVILDPDGTETLDGVATRTLNNGYQSITLLNTGTGWISID